MFVLFVMVCPRCSFGGGRYVIGILRILEPLYLEASKKALYIGV